MEKNNTTAVEWLVQELTVVYPRIEEMKLLTDKAKHMEKEQSKQDYDAGLFDGTMDEVKDRLHKNAEQYYNETYGKQ